MQNKGSSTHRPSSRQRYSELQEEEKYLAEAFKIDNFYQDEKLNVYSLKHRLDEVRERIHNSHHHVQEKKPAQTLVPLSRKIQQATISRYGKRSDHISVRSNNSTTLDHNYKPNSDFKTTATKFRSTVRGNMAEFEKKTINNVNHKNNGDIGYLISSRNIKNKNFQHQAKGKEKGKEVRRVNIYEKSNSNHQKSQILENSKNSNNNKQTKSIEVPKIYSIGQRRNMSGQKQKKLQISRQKITSHLEPLHKKIITKNQLCSIEALREFQVNIATLWDLYEKLSTIAMTLSASGRSYDLFSERFIDLLTSYKRIVCSNRLEFLSDMIRLSLENSQFRVLLTSRLLESLSIVYVFFQIVEKTFIHQEPQRNSTRDHHQYLNHYHHKGSSSARTNKSNSTTSAKTNNNNHNNKSGQFESSHLVNFVGLCSNNLLLLLRLLTLTHIVSTSLNLSQKTQKIFQAISEYEIKSFRSELENIKETVMRIEHNNETISLIQSKLNNKMMSSGEYHTNCIGNFMRGVIIDCLKFAEVSISVNVNVNVNNSNSGVKPFFEYSYFIFQYLSYHLHHENVVGLFSQEIQTAPDPYLPLPKQFTIIINPINTLIFEKKGKIFIRAHTEHFLKELTQKFNVVLWSDQMPNTVDALFDLITPRSQSPNAHQHHQKNNKFLPNANQNQIIKRLYRHHCVYRENIHGRLMMMKEISRVGCSNGKYLVIDECSDSYEQEEQLFIIELPWKGQAHDTRLLTTLDLVLPFLREGTDLNKGMRLLKPRIMEILRVKRKKKVASRHQDQGRESNMKRNFFNKLEKQEIQYSHPEWQLSHNRKQEHQHQIQPFFVDDEEQKQKDRWRQKQFNTIKEELSDHTGLINSIDDRKISTSDVGGKEVKIEKGAVDLEKNEAIGGGRQGMGIGMGKRNQEGDKEGNKEGEQEIKN